MVTAGNAPAASLLPGECGRRQGGSPLPVISLPLPRVRAVVGSRGRA